MAKTAQKILNRKGRVAAPDSTHTGEEPEWHDAETLSFEEYNKRMDRGLRFYSYYCDNKILKTWLVDWMKVTGFQKSEVEIIKSLSPSGIPSTLGKLARMMKMGMPHEHVDEQTIHEEKLKTAGEFDVIEKRPNRIDWIKNHIKEILEDQKCLVPTVEEEAPVVKKVNPITRVKNKINEDIIVPLESLLDDIININEDTSPAKIPTLDIGRLLRSNNAPGNGIKFVVEWLSEKTDEFRQAYDKTDDDCVEGYSWLRRPQLNRIIKNFEKMLEDAKLYSKNKVKTRKPRVKKPKTVDKQVARLKYLASSEEYQLTSVDPTSVPFSQRAFFFNTKNRQLSIYYASGHGGIEIKGTTLQGYDTDKSIIMTLRKPNEFLPLLLSATPKGIDKVLNTLTTKSRKANGRINANMIILRTLNIK